uniref:Osteoclast-stimulating factor 1 n=1 Tax=Sus scrofa TaxID=9823 RepID=A0A8D1UJQ4_PIG
MQARQKETLGRPECRVEGRSFGFSCVVYRISRSRKRCRSRHPNRSNQVREVLAGPLAAAVLCSDTNWWKGTSKGRTGLIPSNYVAEQAESIDNPLHEAAKRGNLSWLRECLDNRVGVNGLDKAGSTALYWACHGGHKDIVDMLFTQPNIELNQQNKLGDTALHAAAWKGYADIVQLLLAKGARTDLRNNEKKLALDMATNAACASLLKKKQGTGTCFLSVFIYLFFLKSL